MKILVVYYSLDGNTEMITKDIKETFNADLLKLRPQKEIKSGSFGKYFWGGRQVVMSSKPKLLPYEIDLDNYDMIIFDTPVWSFSFSPAIKTFLSEHTIMNKSIALFATYDGREGKVFEKFRKELDANTIVGEKGFKSPLSDDSNKVKAEAREWINSWLKEI